MIRSVKNESEKRATFLIDRETLKNIRALALYRRKHQKDIVNEAFKRYFKNQSDLKTAVKILESYERGEK